ncbi:MAG: ABC transporter permease [Oscillospiraceae bacterium]|nr:ABC transporter permease [Oscillospiraceae bacterium]
MEEQENVVFAARDFDPIPAEARQVDKVARKSTSYLRDVWRTFCKRRTALVSLIVMAVILLLVAFGPALRPFDPISNDYTAVNQAPNAVHWFGTDQLGRDLWARVWIGGRVSLVIALLATVIPYVIGMAVGGVSGYFGGKLDQFIMRTIDVLMGIPELIYMILLMVILGSGGIWTLVLAMSITGWMSAARSTRGLVLQMRHRDFITASETLGASPARLIVRHLLPNTLGILVVGMAMMVPNVIFYEAFLSFIGLGVTPPDPSWGQLIKAAAETFRHYPYQFIIPCVCISVTMLCCNLIGDGLRDALDPKLRD